MLTREASLWQRAGAAAVVAGALALLASTFLIGATPDEEEFRFTVLTTWLHVRALAAGDFGFWTPLLGFGVPQPLIANYWMHPLTPVLAVMSPIAWMRLVLLVHTAVGAWGMWRLCRVLGVRPIVAAVCAATFLLAAPSQNYLVVDFWPTPWVSLTTMPWVILCVWKVLGVGGGVGGSKEQDPPYAQDPPYGWAALLGLLTGLLIANANPGNVVVFGVFIPALFLTHWREALRRWRQLVLAGVIALAIAAPTATLLATEQQVFDSMIAGANRTQVLPFSAWDLFLRPFSRTDAPWQDEVIGTGVRTLFVGGPFALLALIAAFRKSWRGRDLAVAALLALLPFYVPLVTAAGASDRLLFRDPIVLCAIPLAGLAAERGLQGGWTRWPSRLLLAVQLAVLVVAALPFFAGAWEEGRDGAPDFHGAVADTVAGDALAAAIDVPGRVLLSPGVDDLVRERQLLAGGLGVNALAYRGIPMVNGWFKGVSADSIWPDERLYYARIATPPALLGADATLDVLGIRYLVASRAEPVPSPFHRIAEIPTASGPLDLYANADAWPLAFIADASVLDAELPVLSGCPNDRLLCRDLSAIAGKRRSTDVRVSSQQSGTIEITMAAAEPDSVLVVTEMFRPQWQARSGGASLTVEPLARGLIAVRLPAGTTGVTLTYRSWPMIIATWLAVAAVVLAAGIAGMSIRR